MNPESLDSNSNARVRMLERHGAASLRALSGVWDAEYRASRLRIDGKPAPFAAPYLAINFADAELSQSRGVMDSLGLRLRFCDLDLHSRLSPPKGFARLVFDVLEQTRCESLLPDAHQGMRKNLDTAFINWCHQAHGNGFCDSDLGILLYTVIHMVRARLIGTFEDETAEALIEATRANLGPVIGKSLYQLKAAREDQTAFAEHAAMIANALGQMVEDASSDADDNVKLKERHSVILPPDWNDSDVDSEVESGIGASNASADAEQTDLQKLGDYHVYTNEFDQLVEAASLLRNEKRYELRNQLDQLVKSQAVSVTRLAREMQSLFARPEHDGWLFGQEEGLIDARRLAQLVSNPEYHQVFVQDRMQLKSNAVISFLIDNSGSMKRQRFEAVAVLLDTYARALDLAGVKSEVLGFTTADWNGGKALQAWRKAGQPEAPGRMGETLHVVYKSADDAWRRTRGSMACLLSTQHFREGVDGEALIWAYQRLKARQEPGRYLVVISDGAPLDAATQNTNREGFLGDHLASVAKVIERDPSIKLGAIGIDLDMSDTFSNSVSLDLGGTLGQASYKVLNTLFNVSSV